MRHSCETFAYTLQTLCARFAQAHLPNTLMCTHCFHLFIFCHKEPKKVIEFLNEREEADMKHAEPLGDVPKLRAPTSPPPEIYKVHSSLEGPSRFYAHMQLKTQAEFQERFDLCSQSHLSQTPEQQTKNVNAVRKDVAYRAAQELADESRGYKLKQLHDGFDRYSKMK